MDHGAGPEDEREPGPEREPERQTPAPGVDFGPRSQARYDGVRLIARASQADAAGRSAGSIWCAARDSR